MRFNINYRMTDKWDFLFMNFRYLITTNFTARVTLNPTDTSRTSMSSQTVSTCHCN